MPKTDIVKVHQVNHGSLAVTIPKEIAVALGIGKGSQLRARNSQGKLTFQVLSLSP
ncbi:MAG: AbrB/MazE/SpoVT family DNA-binding domain-containing protein [Nitrososphaerales archaeon]